ncbi:nucleotidyltransferase domain-containing protein [Aquisalimonas sp.]|uniref:nucleotidyltransferase family protein n=1 Tax=Aquisalimonas sp. TaxID=1872621 RepID=UPI0025B7E83A|nr:nucleotidyltransferase domain-containing protein [Aquisalimonas sp.]
MHRIIEQHVPELQGLCKRHGVKHLVLFGSGVRDDFNPERSDIDLLVTFEDMDPERLADAYFGLKEGIEALLEREIDLVTERSVNNPYLRREIERNNAIVYAA